MSDLPDLSTLCVHAGEDGDPLGSPHFPLYPATTFAFASTAELNAAAAKKNGPVGFYTRYGLNPTVQALEAKLAALENAEAALAFGAGMAAISATLLAHGRRGAVCLGNAYGGTLELMCEQLPLLGIETHALLPDEMDRLEQLLRAGIGLVFMETPTNPLLEIYDIAALAELAHKHGALLAVDNTFATPVNQQPLRLGADLVIHSATKYLGGHSDITAGAVMGSAELLAPIRAWRKNLGQVPAPQICWLLARSLRTLTVRVERHNANAQALAEAMRAHPRIRRVLYPGLPDHPNHELARRQMRGFGGMVTLEVDGDAAATTAVVDRLKLIAIAASLGGVESLATQPLTTTHRDIGPVLRQQRGISDGMIRLSVGIEAVEDLIADLEQALA